MRRFFFVCTIVLLAGLQSWGQAALDLSRSCLDLKDELKIGDLPALAASDCRIQNGCLSVDWGVAHQQKLTETLAMYRFNEETPLKIHNSNLNYLLYTAAWSKRVERRTEAFETVTKLFDKVFPVLSVVAGGTFKFLGDENLALTAWVRPLEMANLCLNETLSEFTDLSLDKTGDKNRIRLHNTEQLFRKALPLLAEKRADYLKTTPFKPSEPLEIFWKLGARHADLEARVSEFLPLAKNSAEGVDVVLDPEQRNSVVILTGQASKRTGELAGSAISAKYFVATKLPLFYHVGYAVGRLRDFDFKQIRTTSGQDLFAATQPPGNDSAAQTETKGSGSEPVAFITYEMVKRGPNDRYGLGLTAGTGITSVGESVYYGVTLRIFGRILIGGGGVSAKSTRGEGVVADAVGTGSFRNLFSKLREQVGSQPYVSISFKVH